MDVEKSSEKEVAPMLRNGHNSKGRPRYLIDRHVMTHEMVINQGGYEARDKSVLYAIRHLFLNLNLLSVLKDLVPIVKWLPKYSRKYLVGDIMSGMTVAVMHIPQGLAYGLLAGVTASVGLYMAFFPVLVYLVFGTSRHISMGTFAVVSMMTLKVVQTYSDPDSLGAKTEESDGSSSKVFYSPSDVATATAIMVGVIQLIMFLIQLGAIASLLSESLVSGFTTAAAVHVVVSQVKDLLGLSVPRYKGAFKIILTLKDIFSSIDKTNLATLIFALSIITFMMLMNECIKPWLAKRTRIPVPAELVAVITGTLVSRYCNIGSTYNVVLVGELPTGLPAPRFPPIELLPMVAVDSIAIAFVTFSVVMSMSLMFAKKHSYEISPNQELLALGLSNIVGGSFSCIPNACSLSRSLIQEQTGGMTQIASLVSALLILIVLLWVGPFFENLPRCVLAGIVVVALKGIFMQAKDLKRFSREGKMELMTWIFTFLGVVLIDIDYGLLVGICFSFLALYVKGWKSSSALIGTISDTGIYVELNHHKNCKEVPMTKIFRYSGSINFATTPFYKRSLYNCLEINAQKIRKSSLVTPESSYSGEHKLLNEFKILILDLSAVSHIDMAGCKKLTEIANDMKLMEVSVLLASPSDKVYDSLVHSFSLGEGPFEIFPTLHDAVLQGKVWQLT